MSGISVPAAGWRIARWSLVGLALLAPLTAMRFTREVAWTASDFAFAALLLGGLCLAYDLVAVRFAGPTYRAGVAVTLTGMLLAVWTAGAVGIVGDEGDPANLLFLALLILPAAGAVAVAFRADGLGRVMAWTAAAQLTIGLVVLIAGLGRNGAAWPLDVIGATLMFAMLWAGAALLFRRAAG